MQHILAEEDLLTTNAVHAILAPILVTITRAVGSIVRRIGVITIVVFIANTRMVGSIVRRIGVIEIVVVILSPNLRPCSYLVQV